MEDAPNPLLYPHQTLARVGESLETLTYYIDLDLSAVKKLAIKAAENKSGKTKSGPITIRIVKRERA